jgi:hypothetical protein
MIPGLTPLGTIATRPIVPEQLDRVVWKKLKPFHLLELGLINEIPDTIELVVDYKVHPTKAYFVS